MLRRLSVLALMLAMVVPAGLFSVMSTAFAVSTGKVLNVGFYGGNLGKEFQQVFVQSFERKYHIQVNVVTAYDNVRFTQLAQDPSHPNLDVAFFTAPIMPKVVEAGLADTLSPTTIPNLKEVYPSLIWHAYKGVAFSFGVWGITYNKEKIHQRIDSWADLLNPAFKGKVTAPDIEFNSSILTLAALAALGGGSLKDPTPGFRNMAKLASLSQSLWQSPTTLIQWLEQGEVWISPYASGDTYALKDPALAFVIPKEGGYLVPFYAVAVRHAANPVAARLFINYILSKDVQSAWVKASYYSPANEQVVIPSGYQDKVVYGSAVRKLIQLNWSYFAQHQAQITSEWQATVH
jgi:putative spermidine/putrescine transport system substrate-binding protein